MFPLRHGTILPSGTCGRVPKVVTRRHAFGIRGGLGQGSVKIQVLLGAKPEGDNDVSQQRQIEAEILHSVSERKARIAETGGQILTSAVAFLGQIIPKNVAAPAPSEIESVRAALAECAETHPDGTLSLNLKLPNSEALSQMADALARLLAK